MRLEIELVPSTTWYQNIRTIFKPSAWTKIRKKILERADGYCEICGSKSKKLECHEKWSYDDSTRVQRLEDIHALCYKCHRIKHFGLALIQAREGKVKIETLEKHFMEVNECSYVEFELHVNDAFIEQGERSHHEWDIDISRAADYLE